MTSILERRHHAKATARAMAARGAFQFGQGQDATTLNGHTACGHNAVQFLEELWHGRRVSIDDVSALAGYPLSQARAGDGLRSMSQLMVALRRLHLPYEAAYNLPIGDAVRIAKQRGPVVFLCYYSTWPEWLGYRYFGVRADGRPNGYARPLGHAGKNQVTQDGFGHYGVLMTGHARPGTDDVLVRDSNHNSVSRPERPAFDRITVDQAYHLMNSARITTDGGYTWAAIPTRAWTPDELGGPTHRAAGLLAASSVDVADEVDVADLLAAVDDPACHAVPFDDQAAIAMGGTPHTVNDETAEDTDDEPDEPDNLDGASYAARAWGRVGATLDPARPSPASREVPMDVTQTVDRTETVVTVPDADPDAKPATEGEGDGGDDADPTADAVTPEEGGS